MPRETEISVEGERVVGALSQSFKDHCVKNDEDNKAIKEQLERLMPLAGLIDPIEKIVENQKANSIVAAKFVKLIGVMGATAAAFYGVWQLLKEFMIK